jgi:ABC-type nickel/cobalt efflux system permease component RcnA
MTRGRRLLVIATIAFAGVVTSSAAGWAHPLGNFTINLYSGIHVVPDEIRVDYVVDMAEIPTFQAMPSIDTNGDGTASDAERSAWAEAEAPTLLANVSLSVGGRPVSLSIRSATMVFRDGQGGLPILRFEGLFAGVAPTRGAISYRDANFPGHIGWREITASGEDGAVLDGSSVPAHSVSDALLSYPQDMLSSPLHVTSMTASYRPGVSVGSSTDSGATALVGSGGRPLVEGGPFAGLVQNHGLWLVLLGFVLAIGFGAWHALLPGHGKTLMAAYMVGSRARTRQAVAVGTAVAVMHTASVLALGLLVLTLEATFRPELLYPWLGLLSGLVALGLGVYLLVARLSSWAAIRGPLEANEPKSGPLGEHGPHGEHGHHHGHEHPHHRPGLTRHPHPSALPEGAPLSAKGLAALALAGGILPAPSALLVMLAAIDTHRAAYGLALVLAFSLGLAAALIIVGIGALRAREAMARRLSSFWGRLVPVMSAGAIVGVGAFLTARGVAGV